MSWEWTNETLGALESFLRERGLASGPLTTRRIGDGHSNLTFLVSDGERELVVRRPPPPPVPPGGHDVLREARLLQALDGTDVPVAAVHAVAQAD
jgi:aminoglycoside phosphotransferase (APT) family kinase protein